MVLTVITVEGPTAAGTSTAALQVAEELGLNFISAGAVFRSMGNIGLVLGVDPDNEDECLAIAQGLQIVKTGLDYAYFSGGMTLGPNELRLPEVNRITPRMAVHPKVRKHLTEVVRALYLEPGCVAEGRGIGAEMFPEAILKVWLDADESVRYGRRVHGESIESMRDRDERDRTRAVGRNIPSASHIKIDTTNLSHEEVVAEIVELARKRLPSTP